MKNLMNFFHNFFLAIGIVWFLCAITILVFELNFQKKEILMTLIFPLAYAVIRQFEKNKMSKVTQE